MNLRTLNKTVRVGLCLMLTFLSALAQPAMAQHVQSWTTVASAGTVNETNINDVNMSGGGVASLVNGSDPLTANIRFNVVATEGLFGVGYPRMRVRFTDNGTNAQVKVALYRISLDTGQIRKILELDSNDYAASGASQSQTTGVCDALESFNFSNNAYYLETQLIRTGDGGFPKLTSIQLYKQGGSTCGS